MGVRVWRFGFIVLSCFFIIVQSSALANTKTEEFVPEKKASVSDMVKGLFSITTSSPFTSNYWGKVQTLLDQGRGYFSSLNLDFRKVDNAAFNQGMVERIREAAMKSMGISKETIEGSAEKSAKVVGKTANKLKRTSDDQSEL